MKNIIGTKQDAQQKTRHKHASKKKSKEKNKKDSEKEKQKRKKEKCIERKGKENVCKKSSGELDVVIGWPTPR